jgi:hypothetical protein
LGRLHADRTFQKTDEIGKAVIQKPSANGWSRPIAVIPHDAPRLSIETEPIDIFNFQQ